MGLSKEDFVRKMMALQEKRRKLAESPYGTKTAFREAVFEWKEKLFCAGIAVVEEIEIDFYSRRQRADGLCTSWESRPNFARVSFGEWLLSKPRRLVDNVIVHELCHAADTMSKEHHGKRWVSITKKVMKAFPTLKITQFTAKELVDLEVESGDIPYVVTCPECGERKLFFRKTGAVAKLLAGDENQCHCWHCGHYMVLDTEHSAMLRKTH